MSDLLSIQLPGLTPAVALRAVPVAHAPVADFMAALTGLSLPVVSPKQGGERHSHAVGGKDLPDEGETLDPLLAWSPEGMISLPVPQSIPQGFAPPVPVPPGMTARMSAPAKLGLSVVDTGMAIAQYIGEPVTAAATAGAASPSPSLPIAAPTAAAPAIEAVPAAAADPLVEPTAELASIADAVDAMPEPAQRLRGGPERASPPVARPSSPLTVLSPSSPAILTAGQAFAVALSASSGEPVTARPTGSDPVSAAAAASEQLRTTVQAMDVDQAPLDLSRDDWTGRMIERIATLRDSAEATDTRIRLAPENLGALEISIRRDGDRMHIHFTAENPATRQILTDAASQLIEQASARGVKLGGTSVDGGAGGQSGTPREQESRPPARPAPAVGGTEADLNERIA